MNGPAGLRRSSRRWLADSHLSFQPPLQSLLCSRSRLPAGAEVRCGTAAPARARLPASDWLRPCPWRAVRHQDLLGAVRLAQTACSDGSCPFGWTPLPIRGCSQRLLPWVRRATLCLPARSRSLASAAPPNGLSYDTDRVSTRRCGFR